MGTSFGELSCGQDNDMCGGVDIRMVGLIDLADNMDALSFLRCWVMSLSIKCRHSSFAWLRAEWEFEAVFAFCFSIDRLMMGTINKVC